MKYLSLLIITATFSMLAHARTGSVHDDFIIWLAPAVFLFLMWLGYKVKAVIEQHKKARTLEDTFTKTTDC